jgi:hypothetical protein
MFDSIQSLFAALKHIAVSILYCSSSGGPEPLLSFSLAQVSSVWAIMADRCSCLNEFQRKISSGITCDMSLSPSGSGS